MKNLILGEKIAEMVSCLRCHKEYDRSLHPDFCPRCKSPLWKLVKVNIMLSEKEKNNLEEAVKNCNEEIGKCKEEVDELKECLESIELNYYDARIEKNTVKFLKFHLGNVNDLITQRECEKSGYEECLNKESVP